jgi:hypothetical protein
LFVVEVSSSTLPFQSMPAAQAMAGSAHAGERMILRCRLLLDHSIPEKTIGPAHFPRTMPIRGPGQSAAVHFNHAFEGTRNLARWTNSLEHLS